MGVTDLPGPRGPLKPRGHCGAHTVYKTQCQSRFPEANRPYECARDGGGMSSEKGGWPDGSRSGLMVLLIHPG